MVNSRPSLDRVKDLLWIIMIAGFTVGVGRFINGLGAATNMTDALPWGFWKVFNMVAGAALATSGFVVAAIIYIFQLDKYRPVARFAILIGFLGYGSSLLALLFDIGLPHRGWHPFFMWNPHSFLFEVFWCVSIYWAVTAFELLPLITERFPFPKVTHFIHEVMLPVVILGITLSTMHHSSLGSLFMASPTRLHPLWYSLWIPPEFFISAMGAGLSVIVLLQIIFSWFYRQALKMDVLTGLIKGSAGFLLLYAIIKIADFTVNDKWGFVFGPELTWESYLFWVEIILQVIIPLIIFLAPPLRQRAGWLLLGTSSALAGIVLHRLNTGIIGYFRSAGEIYIPNLGELLLGFGIISGAALLFFFLVERFYIFREPAGHGHEDGLEAGEPLQLWTPSEARAYFLGSRLKKVVATAVIVIPATWILFQNQATGPFKPLLQPVSMEIIRLDPVRDVPPKVYRILKLDGNLNGEAVEFPHEKHKQALAEEVDSSEQETCIKCHHLNIPSEFASNCRDCHRDMMTDMAIFSMETHETRFATGEDMRIFQELDLSNRQQNFKACNECHSSNMRGLAEYKVRGFSHRAPGYQHAMHGRCMTCHRQRGQDALADPEGEGNCLFCHKLSLAIFNKQQTAGLQQVHR